MLRSLIGLLLLAAIGGGGVYVLSQQEPPSAAGPAVVATTEAASRFDEKVSAVQAAIDEAKRTGTSRPIEVTFTEQELTSKAVQAAKTLTGGLVPTNPQVKLRDGNILLSASVSLQGLQVKIGVVATPVVVDGRTTIAVKDVQTGALPLPDPVKKEIEAQLAKILDPSALGLPILVSRIEVGQGAILLAGTANP